MVAQSERQRQWYQENADRIRANARASYHANRDKRLAQQRKWQSNNIEHKRRYAEILRAKQQRELFEAYGGKCRCCGETELDFLTIEHSRRDGNQFRKRVPSGRSHAWLRQNGYPQDLGLEILCANCQMATWRKRGCPHRRDVP